MMVARSKQHRGRTKLEVNLQYRVGGVEDGDTYAGAGQGVHAAFYTEVARGLESVEENRRIPLWVSDSMGAAATAAGGPEGGSAAAEAAVEAALLPSTDLGLQAAVEQIQVGLRAS